MFVKLKIAVLLAMENTLSPTKRLTLVVVTINAFIDID
jgi:hypothetical protein